MTSDEFKIMWYEAVMEYFDISQVCGCTPKFGPSGIWTYRVIHLILKFRHIPEF